MEKPCNNPSCEHVGSAETCPLNQLGVGGCGNVVGVSGDTEVRRRLLEMGFCNGAEVEVVRRAPLGDPTEFRLRGYSLSLRDEQAKFVEIAPSSKPK
jgi:ferrous iron transport protein A